MTDSADKKPCLVPTGQGFSVLYKGRYLYSRYNPSAAAQKTIAALHIEAGTLVLCFSPLLCYGLADLLAKLPERCAVVCIEYDEALYAVFRQTAEQTAFPHADMLFTLAPGRMREFGAFIQGAAPDSDGKRFAPLSFFRRTVCVELSAGAQFSNNLYRGCADQAAALIAQYWKNRITLIQLGRLFARNLFKNICLIADAQPFPAQSIAKPIVIAGAGPSLDAAINVLLLCKRSAFYLLAADAAALPLVQRGLRPDAIAAVESQFAVTGAYRGLAQSGIPLFADLLSRPAVLRIPGGGASFFLSHYCQAPFFNRVQQLVHEYAPVIPPLGSVGSAAVQLALLLRAEQDIPVFVCGVDFAYRPSLTHCRAGNTHSTLLEAAYRLEPVEQAAAQSFAHGVHAEHGASGTVYTTPALSGYAQVFRSHFSHEPSVYSLCTDGLDLGLSECAPHDFLRTVCGSSYAPQSYEPARRKQPQAAQMHAALTAFYKTEKAALERIRGLLIHGGTPQELHGLFSGREYLYLHFPDCLEPLSQMRMASDTGLLKRIRAELDYFIKDCTAALAHLEQRTV